MAATIGFGEKFMGRDRRRNVATSLAPNCVKVRTKSCWRSSLVAVHDLVRMQIHSHHVDEAARRDVSSIGLRRRIHSPPFLLYWCRMEEIIPLCTSKAYSSSHISTLSGIFDSFRIAQNIPVSALSESSSLGPRHMLHPVPL